MPQEMRIKIAKLTNYQLLSLYYNVRYFDCAGVRCVECPIAFKEKNASICLHSALEAELIKRRKEGGGI